MNIFAVDNNPVVAARSLCDRHVNKMSIETAQLLSSALLLHECPESKLPLTKAGKPYKGGHLNHPATLWCGETQNNYRWLCLHGLALTTEFKKRYNKTHACRKPIQQMCGLLSHIPKGELTPFPRIISKESYPELHDEKQWGSVVLAYRTYYMLDKQGFAKWTGNRKPPAWWIENFTLEVKE